MRASLPARLPASLPGSHPAAPAAVVRRATRATAAATAAGWVLVGAPAHADVPEGWAEVQPVDRLEALLLLVGGPVLLFLLILLAVYIPSLKRGEPLLPDHGEGEAQWIGGPRQGTKELPAVGDEGSRAGGASGRW